MKSGKAEKRKPAPGARTVRVEIGLHNRIAAFARGEGKKIEWAVGFAIRHFLGPPREGA